MTDQRTSREQQARRTTSARRGLVATGAVGALGAAIAIGVTMRSADATGDTITGGTANPSHKSAGSTQDNAQPSAPQDQRGQRGQSPSGGQLAGPSGTGPAQGQSGGS